MRQGRIGEKRESDIFLDEASQKKLCGFQNLKCNQIKGLVHKSFQSGLHLGQLLAKSVVSRQIKEDRARVQLLLDVFTCSGLSWRIIKKTCHKAIR